MSNQLANKNNEVKYNQCICVYHYHNDLPRIQQRMFRHTDSHEKNFPNQIQKAKAQHI